MTITAFRKWAALSWLNARSERPGVWGEGDAGGGTGNPGRYERFRPGGDGTGLLAAVRLGQRSDQHGGFVAGGLLRGEHPQVDVEAVLAVTAARHPIVVDAPENC